MSPFDRVLNIGERYTSLFLAVCFGGSVLVHSGLALASHVRELTVTEVQADGSDQKVTVATCHAGDTIHLNVFARPTIGQTIRVTNSAEWSVANPLVASYAGSGVVRCVSEGITSVTANYLNATTSVTFVVAPPVLYVETEVKKEEPPPPPLPDPEPAPAPPPPQQQPVENKPTAPALGKVGNLLTAPDKGPKSEADEAEAFESDPDGNEYGSGTVGKGGTADHGEKGGKPGGQGGPVTSATGNFGAPPPPPPAPAVDLSRKPALSAGDGCSKGFFPADADDDIAVVQVLVTVKPNGEVASVSVMSENPKGQGFGKAARSCLLTKKFVPGLDKDGKEVLSTTTVNVRFTR